MDTPDAIMSAYLELVRDEQTLYDAEEHGYFGAGIYVDLTRDSTGDFSINVGLKAIDGAQLRFVLGVARRYELEAREENGYLNLRQHLVYTEADDEEREPESIEA